MSYISFMVTKNRIPIRDKQGKITHISKKQSTTYKRKKAREETRDKRIRETKNH